MFSSTDNFFKYHDLFQPISTFFTTLLVAYYFTHRYNISKTRLEVTKTCITEYRGIIGTSAEIDEKNILKLLGLIAEELYYIKKGYIIKGVADEWLKGMIDYMPFFKHENNKTDRIITPLNLEAINNSLEKTCGKPTGYQSYIIKNCDSLIYFPRIYTIFTLKHSFFKDLRKYNFESTNFFDKAYPFEFTSVGIDERERIKALIIKHLRRNIRHYKG